MGFCTTLCNEVLDQLFGGSDYSDPGTWYLGLATGVAADGTITGEPTGNNYSRVTIVNDKDAWTDAAAGSLANEADFTFPTASGAGWGALDTFFVSSSASGGVALAFGALSTEKTITSGDTPRFNAGDLTVTLV